jgi:hypothetical protein
MKSGLRPIALLALSAAVAIVIVVGLTFLPHSDYIRFQQLSRESVHYQRVKWIYERIHFDPTPIDVAFIGTSHTQTGINSKVVAEEMSKLQTPRHVVNFAIPHLGRDLEYLLVRELLENRRIGTLVLEVQSLESRAPHPGFQRLADVRTLASAPILINTGLVENWVRLPLRQFSLAVKTAMPQAFGLHGSFNSSDYEGQHFDDTLQLHGLPRKRLSVYPRAHFDAELTDIRNDIKSKNALSAKVASLGFSTNPLYRYNDYYLNGIVDLAREHGVKLVFLYIPYLEASLAPERTDWMLGKGPMLVPEAVIHDAGLWLNADHLNYYGALALSRWTAGQLTKMADDLPLAQHISVSTSGTSR